MAYRIRVPKRVQKELDTLPEALYERVREAIRKLSEEPRPVGAKKLKARGGSYRIRVAAHRIVYDVDDEAQEVTLITVADRKDVYRS